jgi:hypothetical protein
VSDGPPTCEACRLDRLKSIGAIHRREFVPRDPYPANQLCWCMPRWPALESGITRGDNDREQAKSDFRQA